MRTFAGAVGLALLVAVTSVSLAASSAPNLIAYSDGGGSLWVATPLGTNAKTIFTSDTSTTANALDISPDGKQVLAASYGDITQLVLVPAAGGTPVPVAGTEGAESASFSPDGTKIVFSLADQASPTLAAGIYTVAPSGGTPKRIVTTPAGSSDSLPELSPDGSKLAFVRDTSDDQGNETISLELTPVAGGASKVLAPDVAPDPGNGGHLSFSADGTKLAYAGDYANAGIFTVPVAGGTPAQLTTDSDYWPSWSADGSKIFFSRDATSNNADDNAVKPAAPADIDAYELWTVKPDGSAETVVAEGDFENLALAANATSTATTTTSRATTTTTPGTTTTPATTTTAKTGTTPARPTPAKTPAKHVTTAESISVSTKGSRYTVSWSGKAASWTVTLKVGTTTVSTKTKGSVHTHVFLLPGVHGAVSAHVKSP